MKDILFLDGTDLMSAALGISEERAMKLHHRMALFVHDLFRPTESGEIFWHDGQILKAFLALAETDEERIYCSYQAGIKVEELSANMDIDNDEHFEE
jgi:hypothetical protein